MAGFLASLESSLSLEQMEFCGNFLSKWNFLGILFVGLLARIVEYLQNGSPREVKFHSHVLPQYYVAFDDLFTSVPFMEKIEVPPNWADVVERAQEHITDEHHELAKSGSFLLMSQETYPCQIAQIMTQILEYLPRLIPQSQQSLLELSLPSAI
jgi:hypothetical protein